MAPGRPRTLLPPAQPPARAQAGKRLEQSRREESHLHAGSCAKERWGMDFPHTTPLFPCEVSLLSSLMAASPSGQHLAEMLRQGMVQPRSGASPHSIPTSHFWAGCRSHHQRGVPKFSQPEVIVPPARWGQSQREGHGRQHPQGFPVQEEQEAAPAAVTGPLPPLGLESRWILVTPRLNAGRQTSLFMKTPWETRCPSPAALLQPGNPPGARAARLRSRQRKHRSLLPRCQLVINFPVRLISIPPLLLMTLTHPP